MRHIDAAGLGCHFPAAGNHIRTLSQQFSRKARRQFQCSGQGEGWSLEACTLPRALAGQRRQLVAGQGDFFFLGVNLAMNLGQRRLRLADFKMGADTAVQTLLRQIENLFLLVQGRFDDIELGVMQRQLDVGTNYVVLQFELGLAGLGRTHVRHVHGLLAGIAFATPQVEVKAEAQGRGVVESGSAVQGPRAIELVRRPLMALEGRISIDLQRLGRLGNPGHGPGLTHTGCSHCHRWATLYGKADPLIQLRVAISVPPLGFGPVCVFRGALNRLVSGQVIGGEHRVFWTDATKTNAAV